MKERGDDGLLVVSRENGYYCIKVNSPLDVFSTHRLRKAYSGFMESGCENLVVDFRGIPDTLGKKPKKGHLDSSVPSFLVKVLKDLKYDREKLEIYLSEGQEEIFRTCDLMKSFDPYIHF